MKRNNKKPDDSHVNPNSVAATALYDYSGNPDKKQLSFKKGDSLIITAQHENGWWAATLNRNNGFVPSSYIKIHAPTQDRANSQTEQSAIRPGMRYATATVVAIALYDYSGNPNKKQLSFKKGDSLIITGQHEHGWWAATLNGNSGFIPSSHVKIHEPAQDQASSQAEQSAKRPAIGYATATVAAIALYDYSGNPNKKQLSFKKGEYLIITAQHSDGWWAASLNGNNGFIPSSYVKIHAPTQDQASSQAEQSATRPAIGYATATFDFCAAEAGHISFSTGDRLEVLEKNGNWWKFRLNSREGTGPSNFVTDFEEVTVHSRGMQLG